MSRVAVRLPGRRMADARPRPLVLVPGACLGGWCWREVAARLRSAGHDVYPVTLTGLGERVHLARPEVDLETHIDDVVNLLDYEALHDAVLVGHSYAGIVVAGVADRRPERLHAVVYLDTGPAPDGWRSSTCNPRELRDRQHREVEERGEGWRWPLPDRETLASGVYGSASGLDDEHFRRIAERGTAQPYATFTSPLRLRGRPAPGVRKVAIFAGEGTMGLATLRALIDAGDPRVAVFAAPGWELHELATGHWPMFSAPGPLAALLHAVAAPSAHGIVRGRSSRERIVRPRYRVPAMGELSESANRLLELHRPGEPLLLPNPWDVGSAILLASLGFKALATTSGGAAASLGRLDGGLSRDEAIAHADTIAAATSLPVTADLENGFADDPRDVAETVFRARATGLAGCSIEDFTGRPDDPIYTPAHAAARIAAAAEAAHRDGEGIVLTARAENHLHGVDDVRDTIDRLRAYEAAGADVLYAPGLTDLAEISQLVASVDRPVNVLLRPRGPSVLQLAEVGVSRVSVGGAFALAAYGALVEAARELQSDGPYHFWERATVGAKQVRRAFGD